MSKPKKKKKPERELTEAEKRAAQVLISEAKLAQLDLIISRGGPLGLDDYIVRESHAAPDRYGIYLRKYNVCVAVFAPNSFRLRELLKNMFDDAFDAAGHRASTVPKQAKKKK